MNWKEWTRALVASALLIGAGLVGVVNFLIDPYGEWGWVETKWNQKKFYQLHETAAFRFARALEEGPHTLVFGTSHSSTIGEELIGGPVLNLSISVYGNPNDVLSFLKLLSGKALKNIKGVFYNVDYQSLQAKRSYYRDFDLSMSEFLWQTIKTLDPLKIQRSFYTLYSNVFDRYQSYIQPNGVFVYRNEINYDPNSAEARSLLKTPLYYQSDPQAVETLKQVANWLEENSIPAIYFNTAFCVDFLRNVDADSLRQHLEAVTNALPELFAFNYLEGVSEDRKEFRDPTHHKYSVTKREVALLNRREPRYRVTRETLARYWEWLRTKLLSQ